MGKSEKTATEAGLIYALKEASDALEEKMLPIVTKAGLTTPQMSILYYVIEQGPMRLSELARYRRCVKSNISNLVRGMEKLKLVELRPALDDGRARLVEATRRGRTAYNQAARSLRSLENELVQQLGKRPSDQLTDLSLQVAQLLDDR